MATTFKANGHTRSITVPTGGATGGDCYVTRSGASGEVGVWLDDYSAADTGVLMMSGVHTLTKATGTGTSITNGATVYWDDSGNVVTTTATGNTLLGTAVAAASTSAASVDVLLNNRPAS